MKPLFGQKRAAKLTKELSRKSFHLIGLVVIPVYDFTLSKHCNFALYVQLLSLLTLVIDQIRIHFHRFNDICMRVPFIRAEEKTKLTGIPSFLLGIACAMYLNSKIAIYSLIFGDTAAAFVGIAVGHHKIVGKKTIAGFMGFVTAVMVCSK